MMMCYQRLPAAGDPFVRHGPVKVSKGDSDHLLWMDFAMRKN